VAQLQQLVGEGQVQHRQRARLASDGHIPGVEQQHVQGACLSEQHSAAAESWSWHNVCRLYMLPWCYRLAACIATMRSTTAAHRTADAAIMFFIPCNSWPVHLVTSRCSLSPAPAKEQSSASTMVLMALSFSAASSCPGQEVTSAAGAIAPGATHTRVTRVTSRPNKDQPAVRQLMLIL
jgi:hypothetical protein